MSIRPARHQTQHGLCQMVMAPQSIRSLKWRTKQNIARIDIQSRRYQHPRPSTRHKLARPATPGPPMATQSLISSRFPRRHQQQHQARPATPGPPMATQSLTSSPFPRRHRQQHQPPWVSSASPTQAFRYRRYLRCLPTPPHPLPHQPQ